MPKDLPVKLMTQDYIAARTRSKLGAPIHKCPPIQYPNTWPLLNKAIIYSRLQLSEDEREQRNVSLHLRQNKSLQYQKKIRRYGPRIEPGRRRVRQRVCAGRKLRGYFVDLVTFKSIPAKTSTGSKKFKSRRGNKNNRRRPKSKTKNRKARSISRRAKQSRRKRKSRPNSRRRKVTKAPRRRKARLSRGKKRRRNRNQDDEGTRRTLETAPPCGHLQDYMLKQKSDLNSDWFESGKDEIKEDPLNINDICRSLVKSLPGIPADCREENFDEKKSKPEHTKPQRVVYNFKASEAGGSEAKRQSEDNTPEEKESDRDTTRNLTRGNCVRDKKSHAKTNKNKKNSAETKQEQNIIRCAKRIDIKKRKLQSYKIPAEKTPDIDLTDCSTTEEINRCAALGGTKLDPPQEGEVNVTAAHDAKSESSSHNPPESQEKPWPSGYSVQGLEEKQDGNSQSQGENQGTDKSETQLTHGTNSATLTKCAINISAERLKGHQQKRHDSGTKHLVGNQGKRKTGRLAEGKPQSMRREYLNYIKEQRCKSRLKLFAKKSVIKRVHRAKRNKTMRDKAQIRRYLTGRRRRQSTTRSRPYGRAHGLRVKRRRRAKRVPSASRRGAGGQDNGNNNMNNNQTETAVWYRVSGRLLRIGRYLLRKFQLLFWCAL
ncbi:hypothetical protein RRG08_065927 [Elysia crispata]|uniref:Uncharacterized protein n=1 Tax=Elysia crispata TaxID=231223 RepID=A0AAE0ZG13_9GAST|nr:hypothetical protein RRG08_065927 [Elysia crispata]